MEHTSTDSPPLHPHAPPAPPALEPAELAASGLLNGLSQLAVPVVLSLLGGGKGAVAPPSPDARRRQEHVQLNIST